MDSFIDGLNSIMLGQENILVRDRNLFALALHDSFGPVNADGPAKRDEILKLRKLLAKGGLEKTNKVLGL